MSCCGKKTADQKVNISSNQSGAFVPVTKMWNDNLFEYTGESGLTVKGGISRKIYRFNGKGDVQSIDYRDASGMMGIPVLKKLH
ncbi:MAG: hypothetical protein H7320_00195 [Ferruginibacter sp.]|nr:hypothetical protein [Ferruginibacter sp.]